MILRILSGVAFYTTAMLAFIPAAGYGSSHREAPLITEMPKVDGADFYLFNSYETGREDFVTVIANYLPLQDPGGGPNYFTLDPEAVYEIHFDNNGDAIEDITFQFQFANTTRDTTLPIGALDLAPAVINLGPITAEDNSLLLVDQTYTVKHITGPRRTGTVADVTDANGSSLIFTKPADNIGNKSLPDYDAYAAQYLYAVNIPGCETEGRMFVGQRNDPFVVNLGEAFDLVNISTEGGPLGSEDRNRDTLENKNITSLILELPKSCLLPDDNQPVLAAWTTASKVEGETFTQVSRLGHPLVNEFVIGLPDKDAFNASEPQNDAQFLDYVTNPTLPAILEILFGVIAPTEFPRNDLVAVFLTGVEGLNIDGSVGEMLRLNTSIPAVPAEEQNYLGVIGGDNAGFPNGRRPGDDIVDIVLRVAMGALLPLETAPSAELAFTDGAKVDAGMFPEVFPYLNSPTGGSPNDLTPGSSFYNFIAAANSESKEEIFFFDFGFDGFIYTAVDFFPFVYNFNTDSFLFYFEGTSAPRAFFDFTTEDFLFID